MHVGLIADTVDHGPEFRNGIFLAELIVIAVQVVDARSDLDTVEVVPGSGTDPVPCVDIGAAAFGRGAKVSAPGLVAGADIGSQGRAVRVGSLEATEITAVTGTDAGEKEAHSGSRSILSQSHSAQGRYRRCNQQRLGLAYEHAIHSFYHS